MRTVAALALAALLVCPLAAAVGGEASNPTPGVNQPSSTTGNNGTAPAQESVESAPGITWYVLVLVGTLAVGGVLAFVAFRQDRSLRRR